MKKPLNITNPWEAKKQKVVNPMKENVVEVNQKANWNLLEIPMGEREEEEILNPVVGQLPKNYGRSCPLISMGEEKEMEAETKVTNPMENLLEVLHLPEVTNLMENLLEAKNCPQTQEEREEISWYCLWRRSCRTTLFCPL